MSPIHPSTGSDTRRTLRALYVVRAGFCVLWLILMLLSSQGLTMADGPTVPVAILLVAYPAWDLVATVLDIRAAGAPDAHVLQRVNVAVSTAATIAMIVSLFFTIGAGVLVFGVWAVLAGLITLVVAIRRFRPVGGQWPMLISGGLALFVGAGSLARSGDPAASPGILVSYVAGGAVWFLLTVATLTRVLRVRARPAL